MKQKADYHSEHETKFVLRNNAAHIISKWLECRCRPDPEFPEGIISSIYYDTRNWQFLNEKINSDYLKTKIRLRWYSNIKTNKALTPSFLEAKYKIGSRRKKFRTKTLYSGKWLSQQDLQNPRLMKIMDILQKNQILITGPVYPVFIISYKRKRFIDPVTYSRVCIDYDIHIPKVNTQMLPPVSTEYLQSAVFELKGRIIQLPEILHQLTALGCYKHSFSKYSACYQKIMNISF